MFKSKSKATFSGLFSEFQTYAETQASFFGY